ncbi:MAG: glycosyltransferase [Flavisolibacter sp.]
MSVIFLLLYGCLLFFYKKSWHLLSAFEAKENAAQSFISVIVPARNEEKNISNLLNSLKAQSYPQSSFEIIVSDDFSTDNTAAVVKSFDLPNLQLIQPDVPAMTSSKKKSIEAAIKIAKGELIVTTDADCIPTINWLQTINNFYTEKDAAFIAAPVKFSYNKTVLEIFQAIDFLTLQGITAASVAANFHTMCNGANLAYKKRAFVDVNGFSGIDKIASGDDMLLMHKIWKQNPKKVFYLKSKEAIVTTAPMSGWKDFFMQRKRWAGKTLIFDDKRIIAVLSFIYLLNCLFFVLVAASFFNSLYWFCVIGFLLLKTCVEWPFVASVASFYEDQKLMKYFFFFQPLHIFYTVIVGFFSQFGKYEWKGRRTK